MKISRVRWLSVAIVLPIAGLLLAQAPAPSLRQGNITLEPVFTAVKLDRPVWMQQPPDNAHRWYVVEQPGRVVTFTDDDAHAVVALDLTDRVKFGGEMGLLGLAFHPRFASNGYVYVDYTSTEGGARHTRISRFTRAADGIGFDPSSEKILLKVEQPWANHNGGEVTFGPDGFLYIGFGDGGAGGDPRGNGQNTKTLLGSIARIDVDAGDPYGVPQDNPFAGGGGGAREIFAWGLRNPWRFSFDTRTGELWAGDVGQNAWEEVDVIERGKNYGWNVFEGTHCFGDAALCDAAKNPAPPELEYSQRDGDRCVTGGFVYRGKKSPSLAGQYVFADFVSGRIWAWDRATKKRRLLIDTTLPISSFVQAKDGEIGVLDYVSGTVYHLVVRPK